MTGSCETVTGFLSHQQPTYRLGFWWLHSPHAFVFALVDFILIISHIPYFCSLLTCLTHDDDDNDNDSDDDDDTHVD